MKEYKKDVILLIDYIDLDSIDSSLLKKCDRVAMTTDAMLAFKQKKLSYMTFDDIYCRREFHKDNTRLIESTETLFYLLDKRYEVLLKFPRAFTANIVYFLSFFANTYYISRICKKIETDYAKIYLVGTSQYQGKFKVEMDFSLNGIAFNKFNVGLLNRINIFREYLSPACIWFDGNKRSLFGLKIIRYKYKILHAVQQICRRAFTIFTKRKSFAQRDSIYIIQDGYEVKFLKRCMPGFNYIKPLNKLRQIIANIDNDNLSIDYLYDITIRDFANQWFPGFEEHIFELFDTYNNRILSYLRPFLEYIERRFESDKPVALYYSIGANRICEDMYAYVANKKDVPVFYFQHGGTTIFYKHPHQKYVEQNVNIKKINIYHSRVENNFFMNRESSGSKALGSARLYDLHNSYRKKGADDKARILYCVSVFNPYNYRDLMTNITDKEFFNINHEILDIVDNYKLAIDIKVHPSDENYNYHYFIHLLEQGNRKDIRVLKGFPIEMIIDNYRLLILDCIGTILVPISLVLDIPVILYLKDSSLLREETVSDLRERFYIVKSRSDLEKYIALYKAGKLRSKFSLDIIDKYAFGTNSKEPSDLISDFIKQRLST